MKALSAIHLPLLRAILAAALLLPAAAHLRAAPGDLDTTFNANIVRSGGDTLVGSIAIQPDGRILTAGIFHSVGGQERLGLARMHADSSLDTTFSNSQINNFGGVFSVTDDGKIWGTGSQLPAKYLQFTPTGSVVTPLPPVLADSINGINEVWQMLIQPNGKTILIGQFTHVDGVARRNIARLNANGTVDTGFSPTIPTAENIREVRLQLDGKILIRGEFGSVNGSPRNGLARLNEDGTLDTTFAPAGNLSGGILENSSSTVVQADGKILLGGKFLGTSFAPILRLNTDGSVDTTFTSPLPFDVKCNSMALQADGRIIISMDIWRPDGVNLGSMMRLMPDGTRDTSFALIVMGGKRIACDVEGRLLSSGTGPMFMKFGPIVTSNAGIARYQNDTATQSFTASSSRVEWLRGGSSPEAEYVYFQSSADAGLTWTPLGLGSRISGGWELAGLGLTPGTLVRGRARTSYALLENSATVAASAPEIALDHPVDTDLADGAASINFGTVAVASSSAAQTFTIQNSGSAALSVTGIAVTDGNSGDFTVSAPAFPLNVAAAGSSTFTVTFTPTATGARTTTLQILSNDADEGTFDITLNGTGFDPNAPEILHRFNLSSNFALGANPASQPFFDTDGTMYGTCNNGGLPPNPAGTTGLGTVWKRTPAGVVSRVGGFIGTPGGQYPTCGVMKAGDGNFYGPNSGGPGFTGTGAAYRMTPAGVISGVVSWTGVAGTNPGSNPWFTIVRGHGGIIYGSCYLGGGPNGAGNVWRIAADGAYTMLHEMPGTPAAAPASNPKSLAVLADGTLFFCAQRHIFKRTTEGVLSEVLLMNEVTQGNEVMGMTASSDGNLYGLSRSDTGNVYRLFQLSPAGTFTTLQTLPTVASGANLNTNYCNYGSFVEASDGNFYADNLMQVIRLDRTGGFTALPKPGPFTSNIRGLSEGPDGFIYGFVVDDNTQDSTQGGAIFRVALQASAPEIALEHPVDTDLADGAASINFGTVAVASSSAAQTFTIQNSGSAALSVTGIATTGGNSGDFTVSAPAFPLNVAAAGSATFTVTFTPTAPGARTTTLQILSNDADEATFDIALAGTGNVAVDSDTDGLPDAWEVTHFGSAGATTGTADADNDGLNNFGEYAFGLNPNGGDLTGLPQPLLSEGLMTITVTKQPFVSYTVVASTELAPESFSASGLTIVVDDAATLTARETTASTRRFLRVRAVPAP